MKSIALALAAILSVTSVAWSAPATSPAPLTLTHSQLLEIVQSASDDPGTLKGLAGAHIVIDLRPIPSQPYFAAAKQIHGMAFTCQSDFEDFAGGPVTATLIRFERGEDGRDFIKLGGCTAMER